MSPAPIHKALSIFAKHNVEALLMGGQACILYGAAEFSRDIDFAIMISPANLAKIKKALSDLGAEQPFVPALSEEVLLKGHACHFKCRAEGMQDLRVDVIGRMRGTDAFPELWKRRKVIHLPETGAVAVIGLADLVAAKKTQRDKNWPMIRQLIEADIYAAPDEPDRERIAFWLAECRTAELLVTLAGRYPDIAADISTQRPLVQAAALNRSDDVERLLHEEEHRERELDKHYWEPLKRELTQWRRAGKP